MHRAPGAIGHLETIRCLLRAALLMLPVWSIPAVSAQVPPTAALFTVEVHEMEGGGPLAGALVQVLRGGSDTPVLIRMTDAAGRARLPVAKTGEYRLRIQQFGHADWESETMRLSSIQDDSLRIAVPRTPIPLEEILVEASSRCAVPPQDGSELLRRYGMMVSSLEGVMEAHGSLSFVGKLVQERYVPRADRIALGLRNTNRVTDTLQVRVSTPIAAPPADSVIAHGFGLPSQGERYSTYFAPTPEILSSEAFFLAHCFSLADDLEAGRIGLEFSPPSSRGHVTIRGTVWMDPPTGQVLSVEFSYQEYKDILRADLPRFREEMYDRYADRPPSAIKVGIWSLEAPDAGGSIEFMHLQNVGTVVRNWEIRAPFLGFHGGTISAWHGIAMDARAHILTTNFEVLAVYPAPLAPRR